MNDETDEAATPEEKPEAQSEEKPEAQPEERPEAREERMTEQELQEKLEEHFRKQPVDEFLIQFMISLSTLGYVKMGLTEETREARDLPQAQLAIDGFQALLTAIEGRIGEQEAKALAGALASMQITFAKAAGEAST